MGLQIWLPLKGDLTNLGLTNVVFKNYSSVILPDDNGKIGKCYKSSVPETANSGLYIADNGFMNKYINHKSFSLCAWVNTTGTNTCVMFLSYGLALFVGDANRTLIRLGDSTRTINGVANVAVNDGKWHHVVGTYNAVTNKIKMYVDGLLRSTTDYVSGITYASSWTNGLYIFRNPNNSILNEGYFYNGKANDIRVYDHALSGQEVKDISMGLVAHYQLKDTSIEATTNLITSLVAGGNTTLSANGLSVSTTGASSDTYFRFNTSEAIVQNTVYTLSYDCSGTKGYLYPYALDNNSAMTMQVHEGHNEYTFTATSAMNGKTQILFDDRTPSIYNPLTFSHLQLEKKDHGTDYVIGSRTGNTIVYDSSGYGYHAQVSGTLTSSGDSARYLKSTFFNQNGYIINSNCSINMEAFTLIMWVKPKAMTTSQHFLFGNFNTWASEGLGIYRNSSSPTAYITVIKSDAESTYKSESIVTTLNAWNMLTLVYTGTVYRGYLNGTQTFTYTYGLGGKVLNSNLMLGNSKYSSTKASENEEVQISDFRLYVTAFTADEIKKMYQTAAHTFQNGFCAYEFVEGNI